MEIKISMAIQSHLSDAMYEVGFNPEQAEKRMLFVKHLVNMYPDTNVSVDEETLNTIYREKVLSKYSEK
jgi:hypothetical protein